MDGLPYSIIMERTVFERLAQIDEELYTGFPIPVIIRDELENTMDAVKGPVTTAGKIHFFIMFNHHLLNKNELEKILADIRGKIKAIEEDIAHKNDELNIFRTYKNTIENQDFSVQVYQQAENELEQAKAYRQELEEKKLQIRHQKEENSTAKLENTGKIEEIKHIILFFENRSHAFEKLCKRYEQYEMDNASLMRIRNEKAELEKKQREIRFVLNELENTLSGQQSLINQYDLERKFHVCEIVQVKECLEHLDKLDDMETVFLSGIHSHDRNIILKYCIEKNVRVYVIPRVGDVLMSGATQVHLFHLPMLRIGRYEPNPEYLFFKRLFDLVMSVTGIVILSPIMLLTALAIKLYDRGPVFYAQTRLTKDGKEFNVLKFRSMKVNAEQDGVARLSSGDKDPRITPVGRIIRKCRVDELPQLFNVLKGDMTLVGPRPERPSIAAEYEEEMPEFRLRLQAKAGLTGYAQVYGKYNTTPYDKLLMDLMYISHPSLLEDLLIMFATVKILFMPESTEGVEEGQITAKK